MLDPGSGKGKRGTGPVGSVIDTTPGLLSQGVETRVLPMQTADFVSVIDQEPRSAAGHAARQTLSPSGNLVLVFQRSESGAERTLYGDVDVVPRHHGSSQSFLRQAASEVLDGPARAVLKGLYTENRLN